jgi:serine protease Do
MIRSQRVLTPRKAPSLALLEKDEPRLGHQIRQAVSLTGVLLEHAKVKQVSGTLTDRQMDFKLTWNNAREGTLSSAVPITDDGYFLTAAHCVNRDSLTLLAFDVNRKLMNLPARVVWQGDGPDLALVHAAMRPLQPFHLVDPASLASGSHVVITGWSGIIKNTSPPMAGGKLGQVFPWHRLASGAVWREVEHDVPLNQGDSGGPLLTLNGHLVGINLKRTLTGHGWHGYD